MDFDAKLKKAIENMEKRKQENKEYQEKTGIKPDYLIGIDFAKDVKCRGCDMPISYGPETSFGFFCCKKCYDDWKEKQENPRPPSKHDKWFDHIQKYEAINSKIIGEPKVCPLCGSDDCMYDVFRKEGFGMYHCSNISDSFSHVDCIINFLTCVMKCWGLKVSYYDTYEAVIGARNWNEIDRYKSLVESLKLTHASKLQKRISAKLKKLGAPTLINREWLEDLGKEIMGEFFEKLSKSRIIKRNL